MCSLSIIFRQQLNSGLLANVKLVRLVGAAMADEPAPLGSTGDVLDDRTVAVAGGSVFHAVPYLASRALDEKARGH